MVRKIRHLGGSWEEGEDGGEGQGGQRAAGSMIGRSDSQRLRNQTSNPTRLGTRRSLSITDGWKRDREESWLEAVFGDQEDERRPYCGCGRRRRGLGWMSE